jgi:hypothetical protein
MPPRNLIGSGSSPAACALIPGCVASTIANFETVDNGIGPDNVIDGLIIEIDDFDAGELISLNWFMTDSIGAPIGVSGLGNQYGFGVVNIFRGSSGPAVWRRTVTAPAGPGQNSGTTASIRDMFVSASTTGPETFEVEFGAAMTAPYSNPADNIFGAPIDAELIPTPSAPLLKEEQKCVNSINKGAAKVAKAQGKENSTCIKNAGKSKLPAGQTIEQCLVADLKSKVSDTISKIKTSDCPPGGPAFPAILTDGNDIGDVMVGKGLDLIHAVFGTDLDQPGLIVDCGTDKPRCGCQAAIIKAVEKCQGTKLKEFNACKKNALKVGKEPLPSGAQSAVDLQDACMGTGTGGIPDPKNKLIGKCIVGIQKAIDKKCIGFDTAALFPGCEGPVSVACLDVFVECEVCQALNQIDALSRDCDLFDDGLANGSCGSACAHDKCVEGVALDPDCDPCVQQICNDDAFCCADSWDEVCVGEVESVCGLSCGDAPGTPNCDLPDGVLDIVTQSFTIPGSITGGIDISCGEVDENGKASCTCEIQALDPFEIPGIGLICLTPFAGCPPGEIDCNGGNDLDIDLVSDHNIGACTGNADCRTQCDAYCAGLPDHVQDLGGAACEGFCNGGGSDGNPCTVETDCPDGACNGGDGLPHGNICGCECVAIGGSGSAPSRAGGLRCNLGAVVNIEAAEPCGDGDFLIPIGARCIHLTTETSTAIVIDTNDTALKELPPGGATLRGTPADCDALASSVTSGIELVGHVNFFDSTIGDLAIEIDFFCGGAPICGNGILEAGEECESTADSACPGLCQGDCSCPVCGNNVVEGTELCDGTDDTICPGGCQSDCSCDGPVCGDGIRNQQTEACDGNDDEFCAGPCVDCLCTVAPCGDISGWPLCWGRCPSGLTCDDDLAGGCHCVPTLTPCGTSSFQPTCDGFCEPIGGQERACIARIESPVQGNEFFCFCAGFTCGNVGEICPEGEICDKPAPNQCVAFDSCGVGSDPTICATQDLSSSECADCVLAALGPTPALEVLQECQAAQAASCADDAQNKLCNGPIAGAQCLNECCGP